jgi:hypothetical protein
MLFMVIEHFHDHDMLPVYRRLREVGRMLPEGLRYVDSWVEPNFGRCFQLMECGDLRLLQQWVLGWHGCGVRFEIVPVLTSAETRAIVAPVLDAGWGRPRQAAAAVLRLLAWVSSCGTWANLPFIALRICSMTALRVSLFWPSLIVFT